MFKVLFMQQENTPASLETLREIRNIMDRSARFISLSGWSGVWAGCSGLVGAAIAFSWLLDIRDSAVIATETYATGSMYSDAAAARFVVLGLLVLLVALLGGYFFTLRKTKKDGQRFWNNASRQLARQIAIPMAAGGVFVLCFIFNGHIMYVAPACLAFYGLALVNGSKYTVSDIRYLGLLEIALGCIALFFPGYGLYFWAAGFGVLHILYGIIMWNKYDKQPAQ